MRLSLKACVAVGLSVVLASPALAQFRGGGGGGGFLLMNKSVQEELKLDKDQVDKLTEGMKKFREDHKEDLAKLRDQNTSREEREEIGKKIGEANHKLMADVLKPEQIKRLREIQRQQEGVNAFADPETQKALNLNDKQKDELKAIVENLHKQQREIFQNAGDNRQEAFKKMQELRKEKLDSVLKVLTDEQRKTWKELTGEPFQIKFERPGGGS
jgi:hypothetical protein